MRSCGAARRRWDQARPSAARAADRDSRDNVILFWGCAMRQWQLVTAMLILMSGNAFAADPIGEWLVADGTAKIRIGACGPSLWGMISWTKEPGFDGNNPDPAKRGRPI